MSSPKEQTELEVFRTVLMHCLVILAFPVISFFTFKIFIFDGIFGFNSISSNVYSAGVAILVLHIALGVFIYKAYLSTPSKAAAKAD